MDTKQQLSKSSVTLHWLVGLGMIVAMVMGLTLEEMERSPEKFDLLKNHMTIGLLVLIFAIWRIVVRIKTVYHNRFLKYLRARNLSLRSFSPSYSLRH